MTLTAFDVAEEVRRLLPGVKPGRVQRLVYFAQKHHIHTQGVPLFGDQIEAWHCGPIVVSLWRAERYLRQRPATKAVTGAAQQSVVAVCDQYGDRSELALQALAQRDQAWKTAWTHRRLGALSVPMSLADLQVGLPENSPSAGAVVVDDNAERLRLDDPRVRVGGMAHCDLQEKPGMEPPVSRRRRLVASGR